MSRVLFFAPGNLFHSNVPAKLRRVYATDIVKWLDTFGSAGIPVTTSYQAIDLVMMGLTSGDITRRGIDLLHAPFNHALFSLLPIFGLRDHALWLQQNGVVGNVAGEFWPEFDIPTPSTMVLAPSRITFSLPDPNMVSYSETGGDLGGFRPETAISHYQAIRYGDRIVVPMVGAEAAQKAFFKWQRFWSQEALDELILEFAKLANDGFDRTVVFFMDVEAPLVGSRHGLEVWQRFFAAIKSAGLERIFVSFNDAARRWREAVVRPKVSAEHFLARNLGVKWTALHPQLRHLVNSAKVHPVNSFQHAAAALWTTSDVLSAMDRQIKGDIHLDADEGEVVVGHDPTIISVAGLVMQAFNRWQWDGWYSQLSGDAEWFARRCHYMLQVYEELC